MPTQEHTPTKTPTPMQVLDRTIKYTSTPTNTTVPSTLSKPEKCMQLATLHKQYKYSNPGRHWNTRQNSKPNLIYSESFLGWYDGVGQDSFSKVKNKRENIKGNIDCAPASKMKEGSQIGKKSIEKWTLRKMNEYYSTPKINIWRPLSYHTTRQIYILTTNIID